MLNSEEEPEVQNSQEESDVQNFQVQADIRNPLIEAQQRKARWCKRIVKMSPIILVILVILVIYAIGFVALVIWIKSVDGRTGVAGSAGATGPQGPRGEQGPAGETGATGQAGKNMSAVVYNSELLTNKWVNMSRFDNNTNSTDLGLNITLTLTQSSIVTCASWGITYTTNVTFSYGYWMFFMLDDVAVGQTPSYHEGGGKPNNIRTIQSFLVSSGTHNIRVSHAPDYSGDPKTLLVLIEYLIYQCIVFPAN